MSSSSMSRKFRMKHPVVVVDIGCSCRRPKFFSVLSALISRSKRSHITDFSSSISPTSVASAAFASSSDSAQSSMLDRKRRSRSRSRSRRKGSSSSRKEKKVEEESEAIVKDSTEPYSDFRDSMVQMIVEKELYAWDELNDLLHRFLALNSPRHHHLILGAFAEIWDGVFSAQA